ncbi:hypothetical protein [Streptomyces sp. NPDC004629]|uniref:hypothetical protein n=1 Tax=Streptomyces sp. NPDC004629 TaxID=3364705 RepID=UPI0036A0ABAB
MDRTVPGPAHDTRWFFAPRQRLVREHSGEKVAGWVNGRLGIRSPTKGTPTRVRRMRARLSHGLHREASQIPKPTEREYKEITGRH